VRQEEGEDVLLFSPEGRMGFLRNFPRAKVPAFLLPFNIHISPYQFVELL
jgi:hypothetical protein